MKFFLDKTYLDCTDDAGNCFILYSAAIRLYFFKINYSAYILSDQNDEVTEQSSFHKSFIANNIDGLSFSNKHLEISGTWEKAQYPVESLLYRDANGAVNWNCHHPLAHCRIIYKDQPFDGLGYAETLFLSIKPWKLPIDELRWGRFLGPRIAITWIQWKGKNPVNKIFLNGREYNDAVYSTGSLTFNNGKTKLAFSDISVIREVKFSEHLAKLPWLKLFLNKALLNSLESKYKARTIFNDPDGAIHQGWSIFEIVKWEH